MKIEIESTDGSVVEVDVDRDTIMDDLYRQFAESGKWDDHTYTAALAEEKRKKGGSMDDVLQEFFDSSNYDPQNYAINEFTINRPGNMIRTPDGEYLAEECQLIETIK